MNNKNMRSFLENFLVDYTNYVNEIEKLMIKNNFCEWPEIHRPFESYPQFIINTPVNSTKKGLYFRVGGDIFSKNKKSLSEYLEIPDEDNYENLKISYCKAKNLNQLLEDFLEEYSN